MNRREMLTGMAVAGATVAVSAPTIAKTLPASRTEWDKAMADLERAKATADAYDAPFWRIEDAFKAECDKVPHTTVEIYGRKISTASWDEVAMARNSVRTTRYVEECAYDGVKGRQQLVDAADARDAKIAAIDARLGRSAANEHMDALSEAIGNAEEVLLNMPAPDSEALLWKVGRLYPEGGGIWEEGYESRRMPTSAASSRLGGHYGRATNRLCPDAGRCADPLAV